MKNSAHTEPHKACSVEGLCGACQNLSVPYDQQLADKQASVASLFEGLCQESSILDPLLGMEEPYYYRNKVVSPYAPGKKLPSNNQKVGRPQEGRGGRSDRKGKSAPAKPRREILSGMYAAHSHRIIPTDSCVIENETAKRIIRAIRDLMPKFKIEPYNEDNGTGFLRHAIVRVGHTSGEVLVTLVTNEKIFPRSKDFCRALVKLCPEITTIVQNVNTRQTNVILGESETTLYGPGFILDRLCGLSFRISSGSFYQVNAEQTEVLYRRAIEMAHLTGDETVIDAYCGTGTIGLVAARGLSESEKAARVIGVDNAASSIRDARNNAKHNGIKNAEFVVGDAGDFLKGLVQGTERDLSIAPSRTQAEGEEGAESMPDMQEGHPADVVLMDPPRAGASEAFLDALVGLAPKRIVYISCNPKTQVRDVGYLVERGYAIEEIQPVDMFPHTDHVENIVTLSRL